MGSAEQSTRVREMGLEIESEMISIDGVGIDDHAVSAHEREQNRLTIFDNAVIFPGNHYAIITAVACMSYIILMHIIATLLCLGSTVGLEVPTDIP